MTPLLTFITVALTASVVFLFGWTLGFSSGLKRRVADYLALVEAAREAISAHNHIETCDMPPWLDSLEVALLRSERQQQ